MPKKDAHVCISCGAPLDAPLQGGRVRCKFCGAMNVLEAPEKVKGDEIVCPECGAVNPKSARHCGRCGIKLEFNCPKCGAVNAYGTVFCVNCGVDVKAENKRLQEAAKLQQEQAALQAAKDKRRTRINRLISLGIGLGLVAAAAGYYVWINWQTNWTPEARATHQALSLAQTATAAVNMIYEDGFSNSSSGWGEYSSDNGTAGYYHDGYRIHVTTSNFLIYYAYGNTVPDDLRIEVDTRKIGGSENNGMGVMCRQQDEDNYYWLAISSDGYAVIKKVVNGNSTILSSRDGNWTPVDGIHSGSQVNHITAVCSGQTLSLYANGVLVASTIDSSFSSGHAGLVAVSYDEAGADILFDNFYVYQP